MVSTDSVIISNASSSKQFQLAGGVYTVVAIATWGGGNVALQVLAPDGSTYVTVNSDGADVAFTANGQKGPICLPPGLYQLAVTTATAIYVAITAVPPATVR